MTSPLSASGTEPTAQGRIAAIVRTIIEAAHASFDDQDCSCAEDDGWECWYRLDKGQKLDRIVANVACQSEVCEMLAGASSGTSGESDISASEVLAFMAAPVEGETWRQEFHRQAERSAVERAVEAIKARRTTTPTGPTE